MDKLVRRHPTSSKTMGACTTPNRKRARTVGLGALERWESQKARERTKNGQAGGALAGLPSSLPALLRAFKIGKRAAAVGFDWQQTTDVVAKIEEEVGELREAVDREPADRAHIEEEMGDLLFALANLCRKLGIEPEAALRRANDKFTTRFNEMERRFAERDKRLEEPPLSDMEEGGLGSRRGVTRIPLHRQNETGDQEFRRLEILMSGITQRGSPALLASCSLLLRSATLS